MLAAGNSEPGKGPSGLDEKSVGSVPGPSEWGVLYAGPPSSYPWRGFRLDSIRVKSWDVINGRWAGVTFS